MGPLKPTHLSLRLGGKGGLDKLIRRFSVQHTASNLPAFAILIGFNCMTIGT